MISNGEVITDEHRDNCFHLCMTGGKSYFGGHSPFNPKQFNYWGYSLISAGEVVDDYLDRQALVQIMGGECALWFGGFSPYDPNTFYRGYPLISAGEVITDAERMDDFSEVMIEDRNTLGGHSPYDPSELPYWPNYLITAGEVITDTEDMNDLLEVMLHTRFPHDMMDFGNSPYPNDYDGEMGVFEGYGDYDDEPDIDESQEWESYDPDC